MALYEGNVSWTQDKNGSWTMVARSAGDWNAGNVPAMLKALTKLGADAPINKYAIWLDLGLAEERERSSYKLKEVLAYAKTADRIELVACRVRVKTTGRTFIVPKLKLTKGGATKAAASSKVYI